MAAKVSNNSFNAVNNIATSLPASLASGDEMLLEVSVNSTSRTLTTPSGWTLKLGPTSTSNSTARSWLYEKVAGASESAPTLTFDASATGQWSIVAYAGFTYDTGAALALAATTAPVSGSITPSVNGCQVVAFYNERGSTTVPSGTASASPVCTELVDSEPSTTPPWMYVQAFNQASSAAVSLGFTTSGMSAGQTFTTFIVSLKPAVVSFVPQILAFG
jgi:hypothetical protein